MSHISLVASAVMLVALAGCSGGDTEPDEPVASKACGLISDEALREITGKTKFNARSSDGYSPDENEPSLRCMASAPTRSDGSGDSYVYIATTNLDRYRENRRELNMTSPDDTASFVRHEIRNMRRDRTCSRLLTFPNHTGYICDEKTQKRLTNAFVVPNDRRQVTFFFYPSIDQSVATPENVLKWAKDVDRTIAQRDKIAAEQAKNDSKD